MKFSQWSGVQEAARGLHGEPNTGNVVSATEQMPLPQDALRQKRSGLVQHDEICSVAPGRGASPKELSDQGQSRGGECLRGQQDCDIHIAVAPRRSRCLASKKVGDLYLWQREECRPQVCN